MKHLLLVVSFSFLIGINVFGQDYALPDKELETVEIISTPLKHYAQGSHIQMIDSIKLQLGNEGTLATMLRDNASIYIREYGAPGQLSSMSIRGASPENTAIIWNGINLNSMTLGMMDMSSVNTFYFEDIDVHYGSGSAQYGSGAVGGTVVLNDQFSWKSPNHYEVQTAFGSYGQYFIGGKALYGTKRWKHKTVALYQTATNDYTFSNPSKGSTETVNNAGFYHAGVMHESHFKPNNREEWSANVWITSEERQVQPIMGNNNNPSVYDTVDNSNIRASIDYKYKGNQWTQFGRVSYIKDNQNYQSLFIGTERLQGEWKTETYFGEKVNFQGGINAMYIWPDVYAYPDNTTELRASAFLAVRWDATDRLSLSTTLRQTVVTGYSAPFTPAFDIAYKAINTDKNSLTIKSSAARSYRVPTLNERYWGDNANPEIKPEDGYNVDLGFDYTRNMGNISMNWLTSVYYLRMYDRIRWVPTDPTYAENVANSLSKGLETALKINNYNSLSQLKWNIGSSYSFTHATDLEKDKQLIYVPRHLFKSFLSLNYHKWSLNYDVLYTGWRTTTDDYDTLDPYWVSNIGLSKHLQLNKVDFLVTFKVNNLLNEEYQNYKNYAMPGRNYMLKVNISI